MLIYGGTHCLLPTLQNCKSSLRFLRKPKIKIKLTAVMLINYKDSGDDDEDDKSLHTREIAWLSIIVKHMRKHKESKMRSKMRMPNENSIAA